MGRATETTHVRSECTNSQVSSAMQHEKIFLTGRPDGCRLLPDLIKGDMDSLRPDVEAFYASQVSPSSMANLIGSLPICLITGTLNSVRLSRLFETMTSIRPI